MSTPYAHRPIYLPCRSGHLLRGPAKRANQNLFCETNIASCSVGVEAALHFYKSFIFGKMRFILIASLILFLGIIGTNSAPSREAR